MAEDAPPQTPDLAVRAFIGLFVLGCVLHGFDVMKPDGVWTSGIWWLGGSVLALFDWYWIKIKGWLGPRFAATANNVATDFRWWTGSLITILLFVAATDIYVAHQQLLGQRTIQSTTASSQAPRSAPPVKYTPLEIEELPRAFSRVHAVLYKELKSIDPDALTWHDWYKMVHTATEDQYKSIIMERVGTLKTRLVSTSDNLRSTNAELLKTSNDYSQYGDEVRNYISRALPDQGLQDTLTEYIIATGNLMAIRGTDDTGIKLASEMFIKELAAYQQKINRVFRRKPKFRKLDE